MAFLDPSSPRQKESGWGGRNLKRGHSSENAEFIHYCMRLLSWRIESQFAWAKIGSQVREKKKRTKQNTCRLLIEDALLFWIGLRVQSWIVGWETWVKCRVVELAVGEKKRVRESDWVTSVHRSDDYTARYKDLLLIFYGGHRSGLSCHGLLPGATVNIVARGFAGVGVQAERNGREIKKIGLQLESVEPMLASSLIFFPSRKLDKALLFLQNIRLSLSLSVAGVRRPPCQTTDLCYAWLCSILQTLTRD